ncbi:MAG: hypothetical protein HY885_16060 [Deltaproteobacteria bacterium]|nr:hypothetical protein [Deltaproteobacteria bacterium]
MRNRKIILHNERGFVLVASLLILLILVIMGIAATNTSNIDMQIATNEKIHQQTFYQADGGAELGVRITFENAMCSISGANGGIGGFTKNDPGGTWPDEVERSIGNVGVVNLNFATSAGGAGRDVVYYPLDNTDTAPHTDMTITNETGSDEGGSGGEQGVGYGSGGGGGGPGPGKGLHKLYTINSQHRGMSGSQSTVGLEWKLSIGVIDSGSSSDCKY